VIDDCNPIVDTAITCSGYPVTISVDGPDAGSYTWAWTPPTGLSTTIGPTTEASPTTTTTYTVTGTPTSGCTSGEISKDIVVALTGGPQAAYDDPGPICGAFDITTLVWYDTEGVPLTVSNFFTVIPDSASQTAPLFTGPLMTETDNVWLMIGDTSTGCFSVIEIILDFSGSLQAGNDTTITQCSNGPPIDISDLVSPWANPLGVFNETTIPVSGQFDVGTNMFDPTGLGGTYTWDYTIIGEPPCPDDIAILTVIVEPTPVVDFEYTFGSGGLGSADGMIQGCITSTIYYLDASTIVSPGSLSSSTYTWNFGDGSPTSNLVAPNHDYTVPGTYTITLTITTTAGCSHTYTLDITLYDNPALDIISNPPSCFGFVDGSASVNTSGGSGTYTIIWTNAAGDVINIGGSDAINSLGEGWYYVNVDDGTGCSGDASIFLDDPDAITMDLTFSNPLCNGDATGWVTVDELFNTAGSVNDTIVYNWEPDNPCGDGPQVDSACSLTAGVYTLTVTDINGCAADTVFTITEPPALVFSEIGYQPAYCRLYDYQVGNGQVSAAGTGGTPDYTYLWENLATGETSINTTWGGLNPGDYEMTVTDGNGCILTQIITVDSLNPIADFDMTSVQMETEVPFAGTAPMTVSFFNTSTNFANPLNPIADTTGWWNFEAPQGPWVLYNGTEEFYQEWLYTYNEEGTYTVCLKVQNKNGCEDETCKEILVYAPITFTGVNVFTPNGDGVNDVFTFLNHATSIVDFNCIIVDRWGTKKHELNDITDTWDGTDRSGSKCVDGVYFYTYTATTQNGTELQGQGTIQILQSTK
ncbi:gliding motility-associated C-terminal domain-containing protein, partial [Crocinitomix catalasitica]|nr:gliding motility-associated C-terminal domain-containing protein [Crocinitomix catalasitica]